MSKFWTCVLKDFVKNVTQFQSDSTTNVSHVYKSDSLERITHSAPDLSLNLDKLLHSYFSPSSCDSHWRVCNFIFLFLIVKYLEFH